jgi:hypothetical protein
MPIITQAEVKTLLQITNTTYDTLISTLIPIVQKNVIRYCRNSFLNTNFQYEASTVAFVAVSGETHAKITDSESQFVEYDFIAGDYKIRWSKYNDKIVTVSTVEAGTLTLAEGEILVTEAAENSVMITKVEFPEDIKIPVAQYINYLITKSGKLVKSESLPGGYSVTYKDEKEVLSQFNLWRKLYAD